LCCDGAWKQIIIDDYLPFISNESAPAFGKCKNINELWVSLLEKAYAKYFGAYWKIEGGVTGNVIRDLTGATLDFLVNDKLQ